VRCLVSFGFLSEDEEGERRSKDNETRLGPLRYAHFEIEVNTDGYPVILGSGAMAALPHLLEVPGGIRPGNLRFSPYWDPLRKDPRFQALLKNPPPVRY
jgi:hypothetical protein